MARPFPHGHGLGHPLFRVNRAGARVSRDLAGAKLLVAETRQGSGLVQLSCDPFRDIFPRHHAHEPGDADDGMGSDATTAKGRKHVETIPSKTL